MLKKQLLFIFATILSFNSYSQISFEKGYFIDNTNRKTDCLIKNMDWKNNPTEFEYKLSIDSELKKATVNSIKVFGIDSVSKYVRSTVNIDRSSERINKLSTDKNPIFKEEELFLKVIVEGKATLYQYFDNNLERYFYNKEDSKIEQLIFKSYKNTKTNSVRENNKFRQQLWIDLKCANFKMSQVENLDYNKNDLVRFFNEYSECHNVELISFQPKQKKDLFNLTIRPRINSSSLTIANSASDQRNNNFENETSFGFGLEAEFILPFYKNKWAIVIEPTYHSFKAENIVESRNVTGDFLISEVNYNSIEIPLSIRHYFFLNSNSKIFVNASCIIDLALKSSIEFNIEEWYSTSLDIKSPPNFGLGIGYKQNDKYSLEIRYQTRRKVLSNYSSWSSDYKTFSIILGYSLF